MNVSPECGAGQSHRIYVVSDPFTAKIPGSQGVSPMPVSVPGMGLGPLIIGLLSDSLIPVFGDASLKIALASFCLLGLWGAFHFALCGKALARQR